MLGTKLFLLWAMVAQVPAQAAIPEPSPAGVVKSYVVAVEPAGGTLQQFLGWIGPDGRARFDPRDYPQFVPKPPAKAEATPFPVGGVIQEMIPKLAVGASWHGGNVADEGRVVGASTRVTDRPPDAFLTIIGPSQWDRSVTRTNLERDPEFRRLQEEMGDQLAVHDYAPGDVMCENIGLGDQHRIDVVIQDGDGSELARWHEDPGPAEIVGRLRRINPDYRSDRGHIAGLPWHWIGFAVCASGAMFFVGTLAVAVVLVRKAVAR